MKNTIKLLLGAALVAILASGCLSDQASNTKNAFPTVVPVPQGTPTDENVTVPTETTPAEATTTDTIPVKTTPANPAATDITPVEAGTETSGT